MARNYVMPRTEPGFLSQRTGDRYIKNKCTLTVSSWGEKLTINLDEFLQHGGLGDSIYAVDIV